MERHNCTNTALYEIWCSMRRRCFSPNHKSFNRYGGRGITVCDDWKNSFIAFKDWSISNGYKPKLSIDRIDNDGNYTPLNCRWVTKQIQGNNKCDTHHFIFNGESYTIRDLSNKYKINFDTLYQRLIVFKWDIDKAVQTKVKDCFRKHSKSGYKYIYEYKCGYWVGYKKCNKQFYIGKSKTLDEAIIMRDNYFADSQLKEKK